MTKHQSEADRRAQIQRAARAVFVERGFLAARVEDIAKRAGLSKGAVYFYYASKRELFLSLVREEQEATYSFLEEAEHDDRPAQVKLLDLGQQYIQYFAGLKTPPRFFLLSSEAAIRDEEIQEELAATHQRFVDATTRILAQGMAEGTFRQHDPMASAMLFKAMIDGLAGQAAIGIRPDPDRLGSAGIGTILHGILAN
ncbi:MAG: TetR/AcrR family transcriptional regulator [Deltaproteobacteria bacterium]|nr:MAG: TetR/AcrR family transcriptional regulator [Deltaproteobacteria bacterium]